MNRLFAILIALALLLGLTACGRTEAQSSPGQSRQEGASSVEPGDQSAPPASAPPEDSETEEPAEGGVLVAYFSATGNTENIALHLQNLLGADLFEILPEVPYTDEDLDYSGDSCRANQEQNDPAARPAVTGTPEHPEDYDVVFLGYPIWWGQAPKVLYTFLENCDFGGAVIVPFCTSGSSGIGSSADGLRALAEDARWLDGRRFSAGAGEDEVAQWVEGLDLPEPSSRFEGTRLRLSFAGDEAVVVLEDNAAARDFLAMLPATLTFEDYAGSEKISCLTRDLSTAGAPASYDPQVGDVTLYAPWGNLAIFYGDAGSSSGLVPMGYVESGLELLSAMEGEFEVTVSAAA